MTDTDTSRETLLDQLTSLHPDAIEYIMEAADAYAEAKGADLLKALEKLLDSISTNSDEVPLAVAEAHIAARAAIAKA